MIPFHSTRPAPSLENAQLIEKLKETLQSERRVSVEFIRYLIEVDRKRLYSSLGYSSLYIYLTEALNLSEDMAYRRIQVTRAARDFPSVLVALESGDVHLTGMSVLAPVLTRENCEELLAKARGKSRRQIEDLVSGLSTQMVRVRQDSIRRLPVPAVPSVPNSTWISQGAGEASPEWSSTANTGGSDSSAPGTPAPGTSAPGTPGFPHVTAPLTPRQVSIHFMADEVFVTCLERARALMRHKYPEGRLQDVFQEALRLYLEKKDPERKLPSREFKEVSAGRFVPAHVKAAVWKRDQGRCTYVGAGGIRCSAREHLEFDHVIPWAKGGLTSVRNLRLLCQPHNHAAARESFGADWIAAKIEK